MIMRLKTVCLIIMVLSILSSVASAEITKLSPELRNKLQQSSDFHQICHVADLPVSLVKLFANKEGGLADPGQEWRVSDVISNKHEAELPSRRLIWAGVCDDIYVIHYESGGIAHSYHIILGTTKDSSEAKILWHGVGERFNSYDAFLDVIKNINSKLLDDRFDYSK